MSCQQVYPHYPQKEAGPKESEGVTKLVMLGKN